MTCSPGKAMVRWLRWPFWAYTNPGLCTSRSGQVAPGTGKEVLSKKGSLEPVPPQELVAAGPGVRAACEWRPVCPAGPRVDSVPSSASRKFLMRYKRPLMSACKRTVFNTAVGKGSNVMV